MGLPIDINTKTDITVQGKFFIKFWSGCMFDDFGFSMLCVILDANFDMDIRTSL